MKIIKGNFGECRICDNMDETYGLPSLEDKSWDLCLTDYPFNINIGGNTINKDKILYNDKKENFEFLLNKWVKEFRRISKGVCMYSLKKHIQIFPKFKDIVFVIKKNAQSGGSISYWQRCNILIFYGKFNSKLLEDYYITYSENGFLRNGNLNHPCPLIFNFWKTIVKELKPKSIIDPFMGSGTTAEVCEELGIQWMGYEIMDDYSSDIEKRIKDGIKKYNSRKTKNVMNI